MKYLLLLSLFTCVGCSNQTKDELLIESYKLGWVQGANTLKELQKGGNESFDNLMVEFEKDSLKFVETLESN